MEPARIEKLKKQMAEAVERYRQDGTREGKYWVQNADYNPIVDYLKNEDEKLEGLGFGGDHTLNWCLPDGVLDNLDRESLPATEEEARAYCRGFLFGASEEWDRVQKLMDAE